MTPNAPQRTSTTEARERELDRLIDNRVREAEKTDEARRIDELWNESVRRAANKESRRIRALWYAHHTSMHEVHRNLATDHERKAMELLEVDV